MEKSAEEPGVEIPAVPDAEPSIQLLRDLPPREGLEEQPLEKDDEFDE